MEEKDIFAMIQDLTRYYVEPFSDLSQLPTMLLSQHASQDITVVRCPLLDYQVMQESFQIPYQYKYHRFDKKYILKEITYDYVPKEPLDRPKKGFGVPLQEWLRTVLKDEVARYADVAILQRQDIFVSDAVQELIVK